jgi:hypothetical protein
VSICARIYISFCLPEVVKILDVPRLLFDDCLRLVPEQVYRVSTAICGSGVELLPFSRVGRKYQQVQPDSFYEEEVVVQISSAAVTTTLIN